MEIFISLLTFLAITGFIFGLNLYSMQEQQKVDRRLENIGKEFKDDLADKGVFQPGRGLNSLLNVIGKNIASFSFSRKLEMELSKADMLLRVEEFIGLNILSGAVGGLIGYFVFGKGSPTFMLALIGIIAPGIVVWRNQQKRAVLLNEQVGDSLTGMSNSLRAGYSFQQAMDLVSRETIGPLATEYRRTLREINLGVTTEQALQNLIERAKNDDLELMISAVLIQRQIGGNLAEIFDKISDTIRQRIRVKGEVRTLTAQGKISGMVIALIPVVLVAILMVLDPHYMGIMFASTTGWIIMGGACVSEIIGFMFIRKITDIEL